MSGDLDPRWEWVDVATLSDPGPVYVKAKCRHLEVAPVATFDGDVVAHLCLTCDAQLSAEWRGRQ